MTETEISLERKLKILADAAKYDVACTSSGSSRRGKKGHLGNTISAGICHTFSSDGRCVSLLKILFSNDCVFDCKYCPSRAANEKERATFTPEEICRLVVEFYRRNYIEGLFLSSAVVKSPAYTMERMYEAIYMLRNKYHFNGYIHVKAIPGAPDDIIYALGFLVDRMSVNLELPTAEGLKRLAPNKKPKNLIRPIQQIQRGIQTQRVALGKDSRMERAKGNQYLSNSIFNEKNTSFVEEKSVFSIMEDAQKSVKKNDNVNRRQNDPELPAIGTAPPLLREHRLYQADWLLRYYGFQADELLSSDRPNFNTFIDPKCDWALRHLEYFPVEINQASYEQLLRVPGIGNKSAGRIVRARRQAALDFEDIKKMGVVLKRAVYFITCRGKMKYHTPIEEDFITRQLIGTNQKDNWKIEHPTTYRQLSLFDVNSPSPKESRNDMVVFTCKDRFDDMMTCIYEAWASHLGHNNIKLRTEPLGTMELFCEYRHVEADKEKTESVIRTIQQKISFHAYQMVYHAAMAADEEEKLDSIYRFLMLGFHYGRKILDSLQNPIVMKIFELEQKASNEAHIFRECIRFTEMNHHILVGIISPKCDVVTLLAPHFVDRLPSEDWMIIDDNRRTAVVHPADQPYYLTSLSEEEMSEFLARESAAKDTDSMTALWKTFFQTIGIKERKNPVCQRNLIPLWYRKHMSEMQD